VFFGGKGGVGKTTCACAYALGAIRRGAARVLLVSTDPAHSLGDVLRARLSGAPRRVARKLEAAELDAPRAFARWLRDHRAALGDILEQGTWLEREDVDALLQLSIPGVDELAGILEIARLAAPGQNGTGGRRGYDLVVVDTAPTGHTLRLLAAPDTVGAVAGLLDALRAEHRLIREQLARVGRGPEAADQLIALLAQQAHDTAGRMRDDAQTTFHWVMLPEELSLAESEDGIAAIERSGIAVPEVIVNNVLPHGGACPVCDRRRAGERRVVAAARRRFGRQHSVRILPAQTREPRGLAALAALAPAAVAELSPSRSRRAGIVFSLPVGRDTRADLTRIGANASLVFFSGKGGVGKTTASAAAAVACARAFPSRHMLLLSTDPAHSLADVFAVARVNGPVPGAPANLDVRELDAARAFAERRQRIEAALGDISSAFGASDARASTSGLHVHGPSAAASELIALAPPGVDELFGVLSVVDARHQYDLILIDMAPTGHALRMLELPDAVREWMQVLLRMLLKYKSLVRPGRLAEELVDLSKSIRELQAMLRDEARTRFVVVTRAAEMPTRETTRLLGRLRRLRLPTAALVVNARTLAPDACAWCRRMAAAEAREMPRLRRLCARRCAIIEAPLAAPAPRGAPALERWAGTWLKADG